MLKIRWRKPWSVPVGTVRSVFSRLKDVIRWHVHVVPQCVICVENPSRIMITSLGKLCFLVRGIPPAYVNGPVHIYRVFCSGTSHWHMLMVLFTFTGFSVQGHPTSICWWCCVLLQGFPFRGIPPASVDGAVHFYSVFCSGAFHIAFVHGAVHIYRVPLGLGNSNKVGNFRKSGP